MRVLRLSFLFGACIIILAEVALRQLPVSQGFYLDDVTQAQPIARRLPDRDGVTSAGWTMDSAARVRINHQGFISHHDFTASPAQNVVVVIGDSQVEAPLIPPGQSLSKRIEALLNDTVLVYPVGMSGAPLSQYLVWYRHMTRTYNPDTVFFVISPNDYDESFDQYGLFPGFHYYTEDDEGSIALNLREYRRSIFSHIVASSHLVAYGLNNLELIALLKRLYAGFSAEDQRASKQLQATATTHTTEEPDDPRTEKGRKAIHAFFEGLASSSVDRPHIYFIMAPETQAAYNTDATPLSELGQAFRDNVETYGYTYLDLEPVFRANYEHCAVTLEFEDDIHWNAAGQRVAARLLAPVVAQQLGITIEIADDACVP